MGRKHWVVAAVSMLSLRRVYDGAIGIMYDEDEDDAKQFVEMAMQDKTLSPVVPVPFNAKRRRRHTAYMNKPRMIETSPFSSTLFIDADTVIVDTIDPMFVSPEGGVRFTQFSDWVTTGNKISKRCLKWQKRCPELVDAALAKSWPALNTGVVSFGSGDRAKMIGKRWQEIVWMNPSFIADEIAAQLLITEQDCEVVDDRFNCSPLHGHYRDDAHIWHFHGRKHMHPKGKVIWEPWYREAVDRNVMNIREWTPAGDQRLAHAIRHEEVYTCTD